MCHFLVIMFTLYVVDLIKKLELTARHILTKRF